jgi:hypothetical protein
MMPSSLPAPHPAGGLDGAVQTLRVPRGTDRGAQVHERLVELPCGSRTCRQDACCQIPHGVFTSSAPCAPPAPSLHCSSLSPCRSGSAVDAKSTPEYPRHVRVHSRYSSLVREVGHRTGRVPSDTWQCREQLRSAWDIPIVFVDDRAGQLMQMCRPTIVPEPLPRLSDAMWSRPREGVDGGKPSDELHIEVDDAGDLRLLQHELGDEHAIRITRSSPWQIPTDRSKPLEQAALERKGVGGKAGRHSGGRYGGRAAGRQGGRATARLSAAAAAPAPAASGRRRGEVAT